MVDFINEVEEELRKDDYNVLLKKYGPLIAGVIVLIVAGTGFLEWRKSADDRSARATSASFTQALKTAEDGDKATAVAQFIELSTVAPEGYAGLSLMQAAAIKLETGERGEAVRLFDEAAQVFTRPRHAHLARLKAAYILAGNGAYEDVQARLGPLIAKDAPYEFLARELLGFSAQQLGDEAGAREEFGYLETIPGVPPSIKERARQALSLMDAETALKAPKPINLEGTPELTAPLIEQTPIEDVKETEKSKADETSNDE
ncbi:MAG: tetratricopeptide repeat protein [Litorimonas sp.]